MRTMVNMVLGSMGGSLLCGLVALNPARAGDSGPDHARATEAARPRHGPRAVQTGLDETYGRLPMMFEATSGRADPTIRFISRGQGYSLLLTATGTVMTLNDPGACRSRQRRQAATVASHNEPQAPTVVRMNLAGANPQARMSGQDALPAKINYFTGGDPARWRTGIPTFATVKCEQVYPGVDLIYYGSQRELEYDFVVAPGADPGRIRLNFDGATALDVDDQGDLVISTAGGQVRQRKPFVYQVICGKRRQITGSYTLTTQHHVEFQLGAYDASAPLVIDPVLSYSTYFPIRANGDLCTGIAVDASGAAYITGFVSRLIEGGDLPAPLFPRNPGADIFNQPYSDAFIVKLNPSGSAVMYWTYLGGTGWDEASAITVDAAGSACVLGRTGSTDFPTVNAFQSARNGPGDAFVTRLNAAGTALVYSTYIGGSEFDDVFNGDIAVDSQHFVYVAGKTDSRADFPVTANAFQTASGRGGFLTKLDTDASGPASLVYSTAVDMWVEGFAIDTLGHAYLTGSHNGGSFPTTDKAVQRTAKTNRFGGISDCVVIVLDTNPIACTPDPAAAINCKESLLYATYLGGTAGQFGNDDLGTGIAVDAGGRIHVTGKTGSTDFPTTASAFQATSRADGKWQAFLTVLDPDPPTCTPDPARGIDCVEGLLYSTYLGGSALDRGGDQAWGIALDPQGNDYVTGLAESLDFPVKAPLQPFREWDAFVAKLDSRASGESSLVWSTFLGGSGFEGHPSIAVDPEGNAYVSGTTTSLDFPTTAGAFFRNPRGCFLAKLSANTSSFFVSAISPEKGGDTGNVSATVYGAGFLSGATVSLIRAGQPAIPGELVSVEGAGRIAARFDLSGRGRGLWDVAVTNPGGSLAVLPAAFLVEAGDLKDATIEIFGRSSFRPGGTGRVVVTCSNPGNVDILIPIIIRIPDGIGFSLPIPPLHVPLVPVGEPVDFSELLTSFHRPDNPATPENEAETIIPLIVNVPPGFTGGIPVNLHHPNTNCSGVQITASAGQPINPGQGGECFAAVAGLAAEVLTEIIPGAECLKEAFELVVKGSAEYVAGQPSSLSSWIGSILLAAVNCAADVWPPAAAVRVAVKVVDLVIGKGGAVLDFYTACSAFQALQPGFAGPGTATLSTACIGSRDPNDKSGPAGAGAGHHVSPQQALPYLILFENKPDATAPAQSVVISDQLDVNKVDLSTLSLGFITFGDTVISPPPGLSEYLADVDLRPANELIVRIKAKLDMPTGLLTWSFDSINPVTGQPTDDPLAGFLPPDVDQPEGDGSVFFTVMPKPGLPHGAEIRNSASIVFDFNAALLTPEWLNTIDTSEPSSRVLPLAALQASTGFPVSWSGTDTGSQIEGFTVFVSVAGGPFIPWLVNTTTTTAIFHGQPNRSYAFYCLAQDHAGNRENPPTAAQTTTLTPIPLNIRRQDTGLIIEWTVPGRLQSSETLTEGFLDVPGASSPYRLEIDSIPPMTFWRVID